MDKTTEQNGCMWFVPGSNLEPLRKHSPAGGKHALSCDSNTVHNQILKLYISINFRQIGFI